MKGPSHFVAERRGRGKLVEDRQMTLRIEQRLVLVLSVQFDKRCGLNLKSRCGHERVVHECTAPALCIDVASDDKFLSGQTPLTRRCLYAGLGFAGTDEVGRRAAAHQEANGLDEHRLARSCFAGQYVQPRLELDLDFIDDGEVLYAKEAKHRRRLYRAGVGPESRRSCSEGGRRRTKAGNSNATICLTGVQARGTLAVPRCPSGALCPEACLRTLGFLLAMQADGDAAPAPALGGGFIDLIRQSTPLSKAVLATLVIFSIVSWGIILYKLWTFNRIQSQSSRFLEIFRRSTKFSEVQSVCQSLHDSPLVGIFLSGYAELNLQLRQSPGVANPAHNPGSVTPSRPVLKSLVSVDRALMRASNVETNKLEKHITFLATTAAVTPFIGLFGTVLGIIAAFQGIGAQGSTSLDVVAPGIADALIATAAGLAAAIPAVYFYNLLTQRVKGLASEMDDFSLEFLNIVERNFT